MYTVHVVFVVIIIINIILYCNIYNTYTVVYKIKFNQGKIILFKNINLI